jgi:hypothetical protein
VYGRFWLKPIRHILSPLQLKLEAIDAGAMDNGAMNDEGNG